MLQLFTFRFTFRLGHTTEFRTIEYPCAADSQVEQDT